MIEDGEILTLLSEARSPKPIFFIGAGLSCEIGFPSWTQLMKEIIAHGVACERIRKSEVKVIEVLLRSGDYLAAGELLRGKLGRLVDDFVRKRFARLPRHFGSYEYLVRLPFAGIVTTNYDSCIETAYAKHFGSPILTLHPEETAHMGAIGLGEPFLLKLHGDARRGTAVLSATDYAVVEQNRPLQDAVSSLFLGHPVVFLGYGLSDKDILTPLARLRSAYGGASAQKVALLPSTIAKRERTRLEEDFRVDVATYESSQGHGLVGSTIREAFLRHERSQDRDPAQSSVDFTEVFTFRPALLGDQLAKRVRTDLEFLNSTSPKWGPFIGSDPRAANIAEMLMAVSASRPHAVDSFSVSDTIQDLSEMIESGRVKSLTLTVTNLQTQALAILALAGWRDLDESATDALKATAAWLLDKSRPDGWPRFDGDEKISLVTTLSALTALTVAGLSVESIWEAFRVRLAAVVTEESGQEHDLKPVIAGWASVYLQERWTRSTIDSVDLTLRDRMIEVLTNSSIELDDVIETLPYVEATGIIGWRSWIHPTAAICVLGLAPWITECPEQPIRSALGRCFSKLLTMRTPENSAEKFLFPMMYRVIAISRYCEYESAYQAQSSSRR